MIIVHFDYWGQALELEECDSCGFHWQSHQRRRMHGVTVAPATRLPEKRVYSLSRQLKLKIDHSIVTCGACSDVPGPYQFGGYLSEYPGPGAGKGYASEIILEDKD